MSIHNPSLRPVVKREIKIEAGIHANSWCVQMVLKTTTERKENGIKYHDEDIQVGVLRCGLNKQVAQFLASRAMWTLNTCMVNNVGTAETLRRIREEVK